MGSFRKASNILNVCQAIVAAQVAKLEADLGRQLFAREGSHLVLNDDGQASQEAARTALRAVKDFVEATGSGVMSEDSIRIAWTDYASFLFQPLLLKHLDKRYSTIEFVTGTSQIVQRHVDEATVDISISVGEMAGDQIQTRRLFCLPLKWIGAPSLLAGHVSGLSALNDQTILQYPHATIPEKEVMQQLEEGLIRPRRIVRLDSAHSFHRAVPDGEGIALLCPAAFREELSDGRVAVLPIHPATEGITLFAAFRSDIGRAMSDEVLRRMRGFIEEAGLT
ncbi:LysR family transcriptional regulator [Sulfitobacter sp. NFXS29]